MTPQTLTIGYPKREDAGAIKAIQDAWVGTRSADEGFILSPETLERLRDMIEGRNVLVARRGEEIVSYLTFYRRRQWEGLHPQYTGKLEWVSAALRDQYESADYVLIDHIARSRSYSGDAAVRLVVRLKQLLRESKTDLFMGEISPDNQRSAAFFTRTLKARRVASTIRNGVPWDIYVAPV